jgi:hypothetical protein
MLDDTHSVGGAAVAWPAARTTPSLSHVIVIGPLVVDGFHDVSVMLSGTGTLPVFFKQITPLTMVLGDRDSQSIDVAF